MVKKEGVSQWQRDALFDHCADLRFVHQSGLLFFTQMRRLLSRPCAQGPHLEEPSFCRIAPLYNL